MTLWKWRFQVIPECTCKFDFLLRDLRIENLLYQLYDLGWVEWLVHKPEDAFLQLLHVQKVFNECSRERQLAHHETKILFHDDDEFWRQLTFPLFDQLYGLLEEKYGWVQRGAKFVAHWGSKCLALLQPCLLLSVRNFFNFTMHFLGRVFDVDCYWRSA